MAPRKIVSNWYLSSTILFSWVSLVTVIDQMVIIVLKPWSAFYGGPVHNWSHKQMCHHPDQYAAVNEFGFSFLLMNTKTLKLLRFLWTQIMRLFLFVRKFWLWIIMTANKNEIYRTRWQNILFTYESKMWKLYISLSKHKADVLIS